MVKLGPASIVVIPFPFSDLSSSKLRPAVILANAGHGDWVLCQITSNPYSDPDAIRLTSAELQKGALSAVSFARPLKLFTVNENLIAKRVAILENRAFKSIVTVAIDALQKNIP
jgi:mRNA interferase MazF